MLYKELAVMKAAELVIAFWWKKLSINIKPVTDTSDSIFSASVMDFSERRKPLSRRRKSDKYPPGPHTPPKGTQSHISGVRSALMSKMRKISIVGGFWECDCRVWYLYRYTDKQMHSY